MIARFLVETMYSNRPRAGFNNVGECGRRREGGFDGGNRFESISMTTDDLSNLMWLPAEPRTPAMAQNLLTW